MIILNRSPSANLVAPRPASFVGRSHLYLAEERFSEAGQIYQTILQNSTTSFGKRRALLNLATCLRYQQRYAESERLCKEVLSDNSELLVSKALNELGCLYEQKKYYRTAETYFRQALEIDRTDKQTKGTSPRLLAASLQNLARILGALERLSEAEILAREAVQVRRHDYGGVNDETVEAVDILAMICQRNGHPQEASALVEEARCIEQLALQRIR